MKVFGKPAGGLLQTTRMREQCDNFVANAASVASPPCLLPSESREKRPHLDLTVSCPSLTPKLPIPTRRLPPRSHLPLENFELKRTTTNYPNFVGSSIFWFLCLNLGFVHALFCVKVAWVNIKKAFSGLGRSKVEWWAGNARPSVCPDLIWPITTFWSASWQKKNT